MNAALQSALQRANQAIELLLSDFDLEKPSEPGNVIRSECLDSLPQSLQHIADLLTAIEQLDVGKYEHEIEVIEYRRHLQRLHEAIKKLQPVLEDALQKIRDHQTVALAARKWSAALRDLSRP